MSRPEKKQAPSDPDAEYAAWRRGVEQALGDVSFEDALVSHVAGGLDVEPLYTATSLGDDFDPAALPGRPPYSRGRAADAGWRIGQEIAHPWAGEAAEAMRADQQRGVRLLWLRMGGIVSPGDSELETAIHYSGLSITGVDDVEKLVAAVLPGTEVVLYSGEEALATAATWVAAARRRDLEPRDLRGNFGCDPLGDLIDGGLLHGSLERAFRQLAELAAWCTAEAPAMRGAMVSTSAYHDAGADAVQQLAYAIATGVCYLRQMSEGGLGLDAAAAQLDFSFSVGRDFFLEIAKLRAARLLWSKVTRAAGIGEQGQAMRIHACTSAFETTRLGPWMNLVRGAAQSFAAALGGAGSIRTAPWDEALGWPDDHSRRLAVGVQHLLAEEARLDRVVDAGGGSWYLESLTDQLARRAWELFRELESRGGMARSVTSGLVAEKVSVAARERYEAAATRSAPIIGASAFADLTEEPFTAKRPERKELPHRPLYDLAEESDSISIQELLDLEGIRLEREIDEMKHIDAMLAAVELSMEAPGEPGELMELSIEAAATGARAEQILDALIKGSEMAKCDDVVRFRLANLFELLRSSSDRWLEQTGRRPGILFLRLGPSGDGRAVADREAFARRLFAAGGVESIEGGDVTVADAAERYVESGAVAAAIFAGKTLHAEVAEVAARLGQLGAEVFVAGSPQEHEAAFADAGVSGFVHDGCDVPALLGPFCERLKTRAEERVAGDGHEVKS